MTLMESLCDCINSIQRSCTTFYCTSCTFIYHKKWYRKESKRCFFCHSFHPSFHSRLYMLKKIEWEFIKSGESNAFEFYQEYIDHIDRWYPQTNFPYTREEIMFEQEMMEKIQNENL